MNNNNDLFHYNGNLPEVNCNLYRDGFRVVPSEEQEEITFLRERNAYLEAENEAFARLIRALLKVLEKKSGQLPFDK